MAFLSIVVDKVAEPFGVFTVKSKLAAEESEQSVAAHSLRLFSPTKKNPFCRSFFTPAESENCIYCSSFLILAYHPADGAARQKYLRDAFPITSALPSSTSTANAVSSWITLMPTNSRTAELIFCGPSPEVGFSIVTSEATISLQIPTRVGLLAHPSLSRLKKETQENRKLRALSDYPQRPNRSELILQCGQLFILPIDRKFFVLVPAPEAKYYIKEQSHPEMNIQRLKEIRAKSQSNLSDVSNCGECHKDLFPLPEVGGKQLKSLTSISIAETLVNLPNRTKSAQQEADISRQIVSFNYRDPKPDPQPIHNREPSLILEDHDDKMAREKNLLKILEISVRHGIFLRPESKNKPIDLSPFEFDFKVPIPPLFKLSLINKELKAPQTCVVALLQNSKLGVVMAERIFWNAKSDPNLEFALEPFSSPPSASEIAEFPIMLKIEKDAIVQLLAPNGEGYSLDHRSTANLKCSKLTMAEWDYEKRTMVNKHFALVKDLTIHVIYGKISIHIDRDCHLGVMHNKNILLTSTQVVT